MEKKDSVGEDQVNGKPGLSGDSLTKNWPYPVDQKLRSYGGPRKKKVA